MNELNEQIILSAKKQTKTGVYDNPEAYDKYIRTKKREEIGKEIAKIISLESKEGKNVYEFGAGTGVITEQLLREGHNVLATDSSIAYIEFLKENVHNIVMQANINESIPAFDNTFDIVVSMGTNRYFTKEGFTNFIKESKRILTEKGKVIFPIVDTTGMGKKFDHKMIEVLQNPNNLAVFLKENNFDNITITKSEVGKKLYYVIGEKYEKTNTPRF